MTDTYTCSFRSLQLATLLASSMRSLIAVSTGTNHSATLRVRCAARAKAFLLMPRLHYSSASLQRHQEMEPTTEDRTHRREAYSPSGAQRAIKPIAPKAAVSWLTEGHQREGVPEQNQEKRQSTAQARQPQERRPDCLTYLPYLPYLPDLAHVSD